jgi:hypothetical protein
MYYACIWQILGIRQVTTDLVARQHLGFKVSNRLYWYWLLNHVLHNTVLHKPFLHSTASHNTVLHNTAPQDDGNLVAKAANGTAYWSSESGPGLGISPFTLTVSGVQFRSDQIRSDQRAWACCLFPSVLQCQSGVYSSTHPSSTLIMDVSNRTSIRARESMGHLACLWFWTAMQLQ